MKRRAATPGEAATGRPYSGVVKRRDVASEPPYPGGGVEAFDTGAAEEINEARLSHLASLGLPLAGRRVLDVGCGVGHLAQFFVQQGCRVVSVDVRSENIESLKARYPELEAHVLDIEGEPLTALGRFDVIFCYGLLYHLENPLRALRNMASVCDGLLLLETIVCDSPQPVLALADETLVANQAIAGLGCRPSPAYVAMALNRAGFPFVYLPVEAPDHAEFRFEWRQDLSYWREGTNLRCIFVAARQALTTPALVDILTDP